MTTNLAEEPRKDWLKILFLALTPVAGIPVLALYTIFYSGFAWWMPALFLGLYTLVGLSICAGYHRYYSHRSFDCSKAVQIFFALFGAMAVQNSILRWCSGHRRHHAHAETDWDPYSISRGFWWAHILWIFNVDSKDSYTENVRDLRDDSIVKWQDRWYTAIVVVGGFGIPLLIGALCGDAIAGLLWGGFLRIVFVHHSTFFVNSLAHHIGSRTYDESATARDNWAVAMLTFGEGYHSFHHRFPSDFRNGIRWFAWDPAKWVIRLLSYVGQTWNLRLTEAPVIEKARVKIAVELLEARLAKVEQSRSDEIRAWIQKTRDSFDCALALWHKQAEERKSGVRNGWKVTYRNYRARIKQARREWRQVLRACKRLPAA